MKRTTICPSSAVIAATLIVASAGAGLAQTPPAIQRPIRQAQRAANQTNAQTQAQQAPQEGAQQPTAAQQAGRVQIQGPQGQGPSVSRPASHTVQQGETLWQLAQQYLGDPLLWPEIYRLNTDVVEDPHWIYPGEELRLSPEAPGPEVVSQSVTVTATPDAGQQPQQGTPVRYTATGPTIFSAPAAARPRMAQLDVNEARAYRAVREGEYFSSGFLTEGQQLLSGRILSNMQTAALGNIRTRESTYQFENVLVSLPPGDSAQAGDLLLAFRRIAETQDHGEIVKPTGLLRYRGPVGTAHRATLVRQYGHVGDGQELIRVAPFSFSSEARAVPVTDGVVGRIVALRDPREVAVLQDVLFIDKGADDGVRLGDIFQVFRTVRDPDNGVEVEQDQARVLIVSTRARSATAVIIQLNRGDITRASSVRQVRRMPS